MSFFGVQTTLAWGLQAACRAVLALLSDPDADSPLNCEYKLLYYIFDFQTNRDNLTNTIIYFFDY